MQLTPESWDKETILALAKLVAWGFAAIAAFAGGSGALEETTHADLHASESGAAVNAAKAETDTSYEDYHELVRYHSTADASCDSALESFSRHRDDDRDWAHVVEECHSEGAFE